ncbi:MAG TPA: ABC transporter substrate-binding protein [Casimicrobiaceae bacterium]|nr:ABC transporter substrate-binding protein [Casimicrobiaceae bacterium]
MMSRSRAAGRALAMLALSFALHAVAADPAKVLRVALPRAETGFDPAQASEVYSGAVIAAIMEPLLTFDYLARPVKLAPLTAEALPVVADAGKRYTFKLKKGIYFAADPAFKGKRRELVVADYIYAIKRLVDPKNRSPNAFYVEGKIAGLDALVAKAKQNGDRFDYGARVAGLEAPDRYTLRITLTHSDYTFPQVLALPALSAVAREVVEAYPGEMAAHPVGTGPYILKKWVPASKMILEANPGFRGFTWDFDPGDDPADKAIAARMRGRKMPQVGTIVISVMEEPQSSWLAFQRGELDLINLPSTFAPVALPHGKLAPDLATKGVYLSRILLPAINYTSFNMRDPVLGGFTNDKLALRRAIAMAYDIDAEIAVIRKGQAAPLSMVIPPGVAGYETRYRGSIKYDPAAANELLDRFGYKKDPDGYRRLPNGKPLVLTYASQTNALAREFDELWQKAMNSLRIHLSIEKGKFSDQIREAIACRHQIWSYGWIADYPDGDNFMQLLYGGNIGQSNVSCYRSPTYDALYERSRLMPDSPDRDKLFEQMTHQFETDTPWRLGTATYQNTLVQPRVIGYKAHPVLLADWIYVDIDTTRR